MTKTFEIIIVLALFAIAVFIIFPTTTKFNNCFSVALGQIRELPSVPQVTKEVFCEDGQRVILTLGSCVNNVKASNVIAPLLLRLAMQFPQAKTVPDVLIRHNQTCPNNVVPVSF